MLTSRLALREEVLGKVPQQKAAQKWQQHAPTSPAFASYFQSLLSGHEDRLLFFLFIYFHRTGIPGKTYPTITRFVIKEVRTGSAFSLASP